jgi:hypothetical protein
MRRHITRALYAAAAAGITLFTLGFAGTSGPAAAATPSLSPPQYGDNIAGYECAGRWFRFASTTVTMAPRLVPKANGGGMWITLQAMSHGAINAIIGVDPGGGPGTVWWQASGGQPSGETFALSPEIGDQIAVSIYYDRSSHLTFTATDITQGITKTARSNVGNQVYNFLGLWGFAKGAPPPPADRRMWKVADTHLTTYTGTRGTVTGPWQTNKVIDTTDGTATGAVVASPSGLWNGDQNFGIWLRHR